MAHIARLLIVLAALLVVLGPGSAIVAFARAARSAALGNATFISQADQTQSIDRLAAVGTGNLLLRFEGFGGGDHRPGFIYHRAVYALWPRRVLLGPTGFPINDSADMARAIATRVEADWLTRNRVSHIAQFVVAADGSVRLDVQTLGSRK